MSHMAESQRYVRYGDKDSKNPLELCVASCDYDNPDYINSLELIGEESLTMYYHLLETLPPQKARAVLPMGTAITHFMYASIEEWEHIFRLRVPKTALPMAQEVTKEIWYQMVSKGFI